MIQLWEGRQLLYYWLYTLQQSTVCLWCLLRPVHFIMSYSSTSCIINFTSNPGPSRTTEPNVNVVHEACMLDNGGDRVEDATEASGTTPHFPRPTGVTVYKENTNCTGLASPVVPQKADLTAMHLLATLGLIIYKLCWSVLCIYNTPTGSIT